MQLHDKLRIEIHLFWIHSYAPTSTTGLVNKAPVVRHIGAVCSEQTAQETRSASTFFVFQKTMIRRRDRQGFLVVGSLFSGALNVLWPFRVAPVGRKAPDKGRLALRSVWRRRLHYRATGAVRGLFLLTHRWSRKGFLSQHNRARFLFLLSCRPRCLVHKQNDAQVSKNRTPVYLFLPNAFQVLFIGAFFHYFQSRFIRLTKQDLLRHDFTIDVT